MDELKTDIDYLVAMVSQSLEIPDCDKVLVIPLEGCEIDAENRYIVKRSDLLSIERYGPKYSRLKKMGYSWINLNCAGILDKDLIVTIEYPKNAVGATKTSVNFSGPENRIKDSYPVAWDLKAGFQIV